MLLTNVRYGYNDVMIQPCVVSDIEHRSECNPFIGKVSYPTEECDMLPIFAAPMSTVVDLDNYDTFYKNHIYAIIPRNIPWEERKAFIEHGDWVAVSLKEFEDYICTITNFEKLHPSYNLKILIDVANGHMSKIFKLCKKAKEIHGEHITLMAGNIANPLTYEECWKAGVDYIRCSIGTGCFVKGTDVNTINGLKKIEEITKNDVVLTHNRNYKNVAETLEKEYNGKIININGIKCTPEHLFYVVKKEDVNKITEENYRDYGFWLEAEKINTKEHLLIEFDTPVPSPIRK